MKNKEEKITRFLFILLSCFFLVSLSGCDLIGEDDVEMEQNSEPETKEGFIDSILKINPNLSEEELNEETKEELESTYQDLKGNKEQREKDLLKEIEQKENPNPNYQEDDPNPPNPPIYEKPEPVPDVPTEDK